MHYSTSIKSTLEQPERQRSASGRRIRCARRASRLLLNAESARSGRSRFSSFFLLPVRSFHPDATKPSSGRFSWVRGRKAPVVGASERTETMKLITRFELACQTDKRAAHPATRDLQRSRPQPSWHGGAPHGTRLARKPRRRAERARVLMFMTSAKSARSSRFRNSTSGKRLDLAASSSTICCAGKAGLGLRAVGVASCVGAWMRLEVAWVAEWPMCEKGADLGN